MADFPVIVFSDFTGGLWERGNDREVPPNGLLECTDFMPIPSGGLRAAWAWIVEPTKNFPTNRRVIGFQVDRGRNRESLPLTRQIGIMLCTTSTVSTGPFSYEYWSAEGTSVAASSGSTNPADAFIALDNLAQWSSAHTHTSQKSIVPTRFIQYPGAANNFPWYYHVAQSTFGSSQSGVFRLDGSFGLFANSSTQVYGSAGSTQPNVYSLAAHQDRLIYAIHSGVGQPVNRLIFTNPSTDSVPPSSNFLDIAVHRPGNIVGLEAVFPTDLFVLKQSGGAFIVQGDLGTGAIVRELISDRPPERHIGVVRTSLGLIYLSEHEGMWAWTGGQEHLHLSPQLVGSPMTKVTLNPGPNPNITDDVLRVESMGFLGTPGYGARWVFTPTGYVLDLEGGFWFRTTLPGDVVYAHWSYDLWDRRMFAIGHREPGDDVTIISGSVDESQMVRAGSAKATLPLIDMPERNVEIRTIEIFGQGFGNGGTWQLELTNDRGEVETSATAPVPARAASAKFNTRQQGDWLKIRVLSEGANDASSLTSKSEAPMIHRIAVYLQPRQKRPS